MINQSTRSPALIFGVIFLCIAGLVWIFKEALTRLHTDPNVLLWGDLILFVATLISFSLYRKSLQKNNAQYVLRMIYAGMFAKMAICVLAAVVYILIARSSVNKFGLFGCFGLYFIYTFVEVRWLMHLSKEKKNA